MHKASARDNTRYSNSRFSNLGWNGTITLSLALEFFQALQAPFVVEFLPELFIHLAQIISFVFCQYHFTLLRKKSAVINLNLL